MWVLRMMNSWENTTIYIIQVNAVEAYIFLIVNIYMLLFYLMIFNDVFYLITSCYINFISFNFILIKQYIHSINNYLEIFLENVIKVSYSL